MVRGRIVALITGIMWGAQVGCVLRASDHRAQALPVLILGGVHVNSRRDCRRADHRIGEKVAEFNWGPLVGGGIENWIAY